MRGARSERSRGHPFIPDPEESLGESWQRYDPNSTDLGAAAIQE